MQLLTIDRLLDDNQRGKHPDYEPESGASRAHFKKAKAESDAEQQTLI